MQTDLGLPGDTGSPAKRMPKSTLCLVVKKENYIDLKYAFEMRWSEGCRGLRFGKSGWFQVIQEFVAGVWF
jgi:hypothetical protein